MNIINLPVEGSIVAEVMVTPALLGKVTQVIKSVEPLF